MSLEYVWFTFHPLSQASKICAIEGLSMIDKALCNGWTALELSSQLDADHLTDDADETSEYNRKTDIYSGIYTQKRRFQELKHAQLGFLDSNGHRLKTLQSEDSSRSRKEVQTLLRKRKAATEAFVETINVDDIMEFTAPLRHPTQGCFNFDLPEFLSWVRPHWVEKAAQVQLSLPEVAMKSDYIINNA